ncbi:MAG: hypothetical protein HKN12_03385 [Gemmatimonadetes bacterium]|nr:hypothetical protein [Gemmatimonadota bacterium]
MNESRPAISDDELVDLAHGDLPEAQRRRLLERIADDPDAEERLRSTARSEERARSGGVPHLNPQPSGAWSRILHTMKNPSPVALVGFGVAVALAVGVFRAAPSGPGFVPLPTDAETLQLRSADDTAPFEAGLAAYRAGDWDAAAEQFRTPTSGPMETVRQVFAGSALALSGREEEAVAVLEIAPLDRVPEPWGTEARWTLAVALIRTERVEEGLALMRALAESPGEVGDRARRWTGD